MEHKWNISRRKRGLLGALIGAAIPYCLGAYNNGFMLNGNSELWLFILFLCSFLGLVGAGVALGSSANGYHQFDGSKSDEGVKWPDHDRDDFISQTGIYTSLRYSWDSNYQRNSWD